jgi:uncharacterized protein
MVERSACTVLVFAKAPVTGTVKTRLCPPLTPEQAAELHRRLLWHTLETASSAALGPIELCCTPDTFDPFFAECRARFGLELKTQAAGDLGVKMQKALTDALNRTDQAILIGSDCPTISPAYLRAAAAALTAENNVVIGPAEDGGYGLVGVAGVVPDLFAAIPWGTALVMNATLGRLMANGCRWRELPPIWDVDRPGDLARLANDLRLNYLMEGYAADRIAV